MMSSAKQLHNYKTTTCNHYTFILSNTVFYYNVVVVVVIYGTCIDVSSFMESNVDSDSLYRVYHGNLQLHTPSLRNGSKKCSFFKISKTTTFFQNCTEMTHNKASPTNGTVDYFSAISTITNEVILVFPYIMAKKNVVIFPNIGGAN